MIFVKNLIMTLYKKTKKFQKNYEKLSKNVIFWGIWQIENLLQKYWQNIKNVL